MTRLIIAVSVLMVAAPARAGWFTSSNKGYVPMSSTTGYKHGTGYGVHKVPAWKLRYLERQNTQWEKPGGMNFPNPASVTPASTGTAPTEVTKPQQKVGLFARIKNMWQRIRGGRALNANNSAALENQAGFGSNVRRAQELGVYSWNHNRLDSTRFKKPPSFKPKTSKPPRPPAWRPRRPPPPNW